MEYNKILKQAFKKCLVDQESCDEKCPYYYSDCCVSLLARDMINLIEHLYGRIEQLDDTINNMVPDDAPLCEGWNPDDGCTDCPMVECNCHPIHNMKYQNAQVEEIAKVISNSVEQHGLQLTESEIDLIALDCYQKQVRRHVGNIKILHQLEYNRLIKIINEKSLNDFNAAKQARADLCNSYKTAMILSIQEMLKYLEINEEQAQQLYEHNYQIYQGLVEDIWKK